MKNLYLFGLLMSATLFSWGQRVAGNQRLEYIINPTEVERIEKVLSSDEMRGRKVYTREIEMAADFIEAEFKAIGLRTWEANDKYRQSFIMVRATPVSTTATLNGESFDSKKVMVITSQPVIKISKSSEYEIERIAPGGNLLRIASQYLQSKKNMVLLVDESYAAGFERLAFIKRSMQRSDKNLVFILTNSTPENFTVKALSGVGE